MMGYFRFQINDALIDNNSNKRFSINIASGEHWFLSLNAVYNISGLFDWLAGKQNFAFGQIAMVIDGQQYSGHYYAMKSVELVRFRTSDNEATKYYYQQRYHATENEDVITLRDYFGNTNEFANTLISDFGLSPLMDEAVNMLSTGEFKKACIVKASMKKPHIMFIEEPYVGIDLEGCQKIDGLLETLSREGTSIVIASTGSRIPSFINHTYDFEHSNDIEKPVVSKICSSTGLSVSNYPKPAKVDFENALELRNATVTYGERDVLKSIYWKVKKGEKWALTGKNGTGKSTLLSLVYADNPQVYSNEVYVFDRQRGTGESIWDIKDNIGYYSSELHRYFNKTETVENALHSLIFCNPFNKKELSDEIKQFKNELLANFGLDILLQKQLYELSTVQQKLILLCSALIKNPPLLILDEPFQGFDDELVQKCRVLIDEYCKNRTLIFVSHVPDEFPGCVEYKFELGKNINHRETENKVLSLCNSQ